ncbi:hypothetical protein FSC37_20135 [Piscinibacter aquaticus]|uniref:Uncharacterized protein n=1 Tax=Piscinibacter aquaticus TaxID=392597 RepID=A0A5C6U5N4_9BURK|nr:hypothetical protein FSC37_20135 [Piscinibacter aquaticus]
MSIDHFPPRGGWPERIAAALLRGSLQLLLKPVFSPRVPIPFQRLWLKGGPHHAAAARHALRGRSPGRRAG